MDKQEIQIKCKGTSAIDISQLKFYKGRKVKTFVCKKCGNPIRSTWKRVLCNECMRPKRIVNCENCNKEIKISRDQEKLNHHFCSKKCYLEYLDKKSQIVKCDCCGKSIRITPKKINQEHHFCSRGCKYKWNRGKNNYGWIGGTLRYRGENWNEKRKEALKRDKYVCHLSGEKEENAKLDVHHIIPYRISKINYLWNLIVLKRNLHKRIEFLNIEIAQKLQKKGFSEAQAWKFILVFIYNALIREKINKSFFMKILYYSREKTSNFIVNFLLEKHNESKLKYYKRRFDNG